MSRRDYMYRIVEEYQQGLHTIKEISKKYNINASKLSYWKNKYNEEPGNVSEFIEITRTGNTFSGIQICYPNGVSININQSVCQEDIKALINLI